MLSFCKESIHARSCRIHCFKMRRKTMSLGRRCPSGRIRSGRKCSSPALTHPSETAPSRRVKVIPWMMDSATPPCGCAQNDGMVGDVQGSFRNEGRVRSCSCGADSSELPLPVCAPHKDRGEGLCFRTFPTTFRARFLDVPMEATSIQNNFYPVTDSLVSVLIAT